MISRPLLSVVLICVLACAGGAPELGGSSLPDPEPVVAEPDIPVALSGFAYVPGPDGGAEGARFSRFSGGETVIVGVDDANLRDASGSDTVVATLALGSEVTIVEAIGEPVQLIGRTNIWYRVDAGEQEGRLFGALLTPFGGRDFFGESHPEERGWAVTFSPSGKPRLRVDREPGSNEAVSLDLEPTTRFAGGTLEAAMIGWGDFEMRIQASLCRLDGGEAPDCSVAEAGLGADGKSLEQFSPPDPWQYALDPTASSVCGATRELPATVEAGELVLELQTPQYLRGSDGVVKCFDVGRATGVPYAGDQLVSCVTDGGGKVGPSTASVGRYIRAADTWTFLPCASHDWQGSDVHAALVEKRIRVAIDAGVSAPMQLSTPTTLPVDQGTLTLAHRSLGKGVPEGAKRIFENPALGPVYAAPEGPRSTNAMIVPQADGTRLHYGWRPDLTWPDGAPSNAGYSVLTMGCGGDAEVFMNLEPELTKQGLSVLTALEDGTSIYKPTEQGHWMNERLFKVYLDLSEAPEYARSASLELGLSPEQLLAGDPWLFLQDPWGRWVRLMRDDLQPPAMCEPILYVYADPPQPVSIRPLEPLYFFRTEPLGMNGWKGLAQPDGSMVIDGRRWPELFWEGRGLWFRPPVQTVVVASADLEDFLGESLRSQGLRGREIDGFLNAWLPDLEVHAAVRIGFHDRDLIDAVAPLGIDPEPETFIRVLMDATPVRGERPQGSKLSFEEPAARKGLVVVEWGGVLRALEASR